MTEIRPLAPADYDAWLALWHGYIEFYESKVSDEQTVLTWNRILDPGFPIHGAVAVDDDGRVIGFVHWVTHSATWSESPSVYLEDLFVAASTRGAGVGRALIAQVTEWARQHDAAKVYWLTQETNAVARALYDSIATHTGFVHYEIGLDR